MRFHAVFWPAFLMAAGLPLPKHIFAHGWLLFENDKMSKSRGNIVRSEPIRQVMGADALRYFLLREVVFGQDGSFSYDALIGRYNSDLANGLGNLASRTLTMIHQYRKGVMPEKPADWATRPRLVRDTMKGGPNAGWIGGPVRAVRILKGVGSDLGSHLVVDKFIVRTAPWKLAREPEAADRRRSLGDALYSAAEALRIITALVSPVLPESSRKIWAQLGMK